MCTKNNAKLGFSFDIYKSVDAYFTKMLIYSMLCTYTFADPKMFLCKIFADPEMFVCKILAIPEMFGGYFKGHGTGLAAKSIKEVNMRLI